MPDIRPIRIDQIDTSGRLRAVRDAYVAAMVEAIQAGDALPPIDVVERDNAKLPFRLVAGGHRTAAYAAAGSATIWARVFSAGEFADEAAIKLAEIKENMLRFELTVLDRAIHLAKWKEIHEATIPAPKRGRKPAAIDPEKLAQDSAAFSASFTTAAAEALKISERSVQVAVQIAAGIGAPIRDRITGAPIADSQSELLQLAAQAPDRQVAIVNLLLSTPPAARSVAEAVARLDRTPAPAKLAGWQKAAESFARLREQEQFAFFDANADKINLWLATRTR